MKTIVKLLYASVLALGLTACGGGGGKDPARASANTPPASAAASVEGFVAYLQRLVANQGDGTVPLDVGDFVAPTSDTTEALPV